MSWWESITEPASSSSRTGTGRQGAVGLGQHQQAFDQLLVALVGAQQVRAKAPQVVGRFRVIQRHFGEQPLHRQRGTQLV